jgi:hypothetical protein
MGGFVLSPLGGRWQSPQAPGCIVLADLQRSIPPRVLQRRVGRYRWVTQICHERDLQLSSARAMASGWHIPPAMKST